MTEVIRSDFMSQKLCLFRYSSLVGIVDLFSLHDALRLSHAG